MTCPRWRHVEGAVKGKGGNPHPPFFGPEMSVASGKAASTPNLAPSAFGGGCELGWRGGGASFGGVKLFAACRGRRTAQAEGPLGVGVLGHQRLKRHVILMLPEPGSPWTGSGDHEEIVGWEVGNVSSPQKGMIKPLSWSPADKLVWEISRSPFQLKRGFVVFPLSLGMHAGSTSSNVKVWSWGVDLCELLAFLPPCAPQ